MTAVRAEPGGRSRRRAGRAVNRNVTLLVGGVVTALFCAAAIASLFLRQAAYTQHLADRLLPPGSPGHLLGTDTLGRDVLARIMTGCRISLQIGLAAVLISGVLGIIVGAVAGYVGHAVDDVLMRITDAVMAIPLVLFALSVIAVIGGGVVNLILVISFAQWMTYARTARSETLVVRESLFVTAAVSLGAKPRRILFRHIIPQLIPSAIVIATLNISFAILLEAGLSFLGLGIRPPDPSLGSMLTDGRQYIQSAYWLGLYPGVALVLLVLGINLLGDGLRTRSDRRGGSR